MGTIAILLNAKELHYDSGKKHAATIVKRMDIILLKLELATLIISLAWKYRTQRMDSFILTYKLFEFRPGFFRNRYSCRLIARYSCCKPSHVLSEIHFLKNSPAHTMS